jgi:hypothetical protein
MKKHLIRVYEFVCLISPPVILTPILKLLVALKFSMQFMTLEKTLKKNFQLKGIAKSKTAYLLATGPSIKRKDLSLLKGQDCFSVSNFYLHHDIQIIAPKFHFFAPFHPPLNLENYLDWLKEADATLPPETSIVLSVSGKQMIEENSIFKERDIFYLCLEKRPIFGYCNLLTPIMAPQSSPLMVLPVLAYMGYTKIILVGCDHTILRDYKSVVKNFYDPTHDSRENATNGDNWKDGIIKHLENAHTVFQQYKFYQAKFKENNIAIYNASDDSWLDFFESTEIKISTKNIMRS